MLRCDQLQQLKSNAGFLVPVAWINSQTPAQWATGRSIHDQMSMKLVQTQVQCKMQTKWSILVALMIIKLYWAWAVHPLRSHVLMLLPNCCSVMQGDANGRVQEGYVTPPSLQIRTTISVDRLYTMTRILENCKISQCFMWKQFTGRKFFANFKIELSYFLSQGAYSEHILQVNILCATVL